MAPAAGMGPATEGMSPIAYPKSADTYARDQTGRIQHIEHFFDLGPREVHPWQKPAMPTQEQLQQSANSPIIVTANPMMKQQTINGHVDPTHELPINGEAMSISSSMFEGKIEVHLKGLPTSQKSIFDGKKRFFQVMVQGRFKRPVDADGLCMGQEFVRAGNIPPWIAEMVLSAAAKVFSASAQVDIWAMLPYFMSPVLAACQMVNVSKPGQEPSLAEATEDMRLFSPDLADKHGEPLSADKRRKWCDQPKNLAGKQFSPDNVYTFHIWQHLIDFSTYKLCIGGYVNLDLTQALSGQPLQLTCKDTHSDEYMFSMLVWHERLLYGSDTTAAAALADKLSSWGKGFRSMLGGAKK